MALAAATVLEVRNGGSDTAGGGFVTGSSGTDWSLQTTLQYSVTDGVTAGTTTITSATAAFGTDVVGNLISVSGGTGAVVQGWYQIISRTNATTIVVDRSTGLTAGTGATLKIGGALASLGTAASIATVAGNIVYVKYNASPFVATTASTNVSGGTVVGSIGTAYAGYDTTRTRSNTDANRPTFQVGSAVASATLFATAGAISNFILDGNSQTSSRGTNGVTYADRCKAINCSTGGFASSTCYRCEATANTGPGFSGSTAEYCEAYANANIGFSALSAFSCLSYGNTGGTGVGFSNCNTLGRCTAYGNASTGFAFIASSAVIRVSNLIAESNTGVGFSVTQSSTRLQLFNCASFGNSARSSTAGIAIEDVGAITGAATFFTNAAGGVFVLNTGANGALVRGLGTPSLFPAGLTANVVDVGGAEAAPDYPATTNVRNATVFAATTKTGSLVVPTAGQVQAGVTFDNGTVGTLASSGGHVLGGGV